MNKIKISCTDCFEKSYCFHQLNQHELFLTNESRVQVHYKKGETIAKQGSFVTNILYVKEGIVKVYKEFENKNNLIFSIFPKGSLIGLSSLFFTDKFQYSVSALKDTNICAIDKNVIQQIVKDNSNFGVSLLESLNKEMYNIRSRMISLTQKQLPGKVSDIVLYLADEVFGNSEFELPLSRKDIAEFGGMSTMSVVRTLQQFNKEGYIEENKHKIILKDKEALKRISTDGFLNDDSE